MGGSIIWSGSTRIWPRHGSVSVELLDPAGRALASAKAVSSAAVELRATGAAGRLAQLQDDRNWSAAGEGRAFRATGDIYRDAGAIGAMSISVPTRAYGNGRGGANTQESILT